jgi:hypothetical protein
MGQTAPQEAKAPAAPQLSPLGLDEQADFEIVLGRGQVASTMLLVLVVLVVFGGGGYVIGKSASPKVAVVQAAAPAPSALAPVEKPAPAAMKAPEAPAPAVSAPVVSAPLSASLSAPLFSEQEPGKVYLQVGAVDKGLAGIWAEGLRTHGLAAFVAPGPTATVWRVVIGPLPTPQSFEQAKATLDRLGINTFGRKQQ